MSAKLISSSLISASNDCFKVGQFENRLDALLADLQKSVPGHQNLASGVRSIQQYKIDQEQYGATPGYGTLKERADSQSPTYLEHYSTIETRTSPLPHSQNNSMGRVTPSQSYSYRSQVTQAQGGGYNSSVILPQSQNQTHNNTNMSELDSLLQDLSSARFNNFDNKKDYALPISSNGKPSGYNTVSSFSVEERPTVDSLLDEMDNASIYAVPNGSAHKSPTPGRHVTITVRETKTEKLTEPQDSVLPIEKNVQERETFTQNNASNFYASSATKELDDLMASLSDIKVSNGSHHHQTVTDYAKPNKGISHLTKTITETTTFVEDTGVDQLDSMLGSLQANMSRQGVNTIQKGCCNACEKPIVGQVITALGKTWHPEHFTCNHCNQELGTRNFFERDGFPYCETDYHNLFSPRCAYCNGAILDKCVTALDKTWHTEHFFCAQCGQQFGEDGFHERDGKPYCRNDYFEMFAPKCNGCNRAIMENYISALNSQWHPDCFVCRDCKKAVRGKSFYAMEGKPVCPTCVGVEDEE